jgi:hypothetical protein
MLSRKKALDDGAGELRCLLALVAWVVYRFDLANARATCRFWLDDIPMVRYPRTALHAAVLRCLVPGLRTTGLGERF